MSLDKSNIANKMMEQAPAKKGFHFPATSGYYAAYIEAATIEEAEAMYHKAKRPIAPVEGSPVSTLPENEAGSKDAVI